jgi:purine-binding chemotaxis protein CheW
MAQTITSENAPETLFAAFSVREGRYALGAAGIQEVIRLGPLTRVRHAPAEVAGIMNLRGKIVTVVDLGLRLGLPKALYGNDSRILIVESRGEFIGLLVDQVDDVMEVEPGEWEPLPANLSAGQARFFQGVCRDKGRVISILDADRILTQGED